MDKISLCSPDSPGTHCPGWPWTHRGPCSVLELKACATTARQLEFSLIMHLCSSSLSKTSDPTSGPRLFPLSLLGPLCTILLGVSLGSPHLLDLCVLGGLGPESAAHLSVSSFRGVTMGRSLALGGIGCHSLFSWVTLVICDLTQDAGTHCVCLAGCALSRDVHILGLGVCRAAALGSS